MSVTSRYSPERRTALVLTGTGAHGAYHAGVLRALQEAGVKIDVFAGHGIGAANAAVAAIDGQSRLWDADGVWSQPSGMARYEWKRSVRVSGWLLALLAVVVFAPLLLVLASGLVVYPLTFLLEMLRGGAGVDVLASYSAWLQWAFSGQNLPTAAPRLGAVVVVALAVLFIVGATLARRVERRTRRTHGALWWSVIGSPLDAARARSVFTTAIWQLIRGAAPTAHPSMTALSRRYAEVLGESLGQPGFREVVLVATDLDERRDVVAALLREPFRHDFMAPRQHRDRRSEVLDLADAGRDRAMDVLAAALTPPVACDPHLVTFASDSVWQGEAHRLCDRPGAIYRVLEEVAAAGVTQAIVVTAAPSASGPHRLQPVRLDLRHRLGEFVMAAESAGLRDGLDMARLHFDAVYVIRPAHNPLGPFDAAGAYDEASHRHCEVAELMERAYEDAYRQFIEPVVGASGEHLARHPMTGGQEAEKPAGLSVL